jgi:hypothetical protein
MKDKRRMSSLSYIGRYLTRPHRTGLARIYYRIGPYSLAYHNLPLVRQLPFGL